MDIERLGSTTPRQAGPSDAPTIATLLHDFNVEFAEPSPGPDVLARRLNGLLAADGTVALLAGEPALGFALMTLRPNVWYDTPVALLDELYVVPAARGHGIGSGLVEACCSVVRLRGVDLLEISVDGGDRDARRFYETHGFRCMHGQPPEPALYYSRELT